MAVYKSTYCYPFLNSVDVRVAKTSAYSTYPVQYLKCKVDTSNKKITGYKIRLLDSDNDQIFPTKGSEGYISPLKELRQGNMLDIYDSAGTNSGINGTYLQLPFFQTYNEQKLSTYNAIYYKGLFFADHIITSSTLGVQAGITLFPSELLSNWKADTTVIPGERCLVYSWPDSDDVYMVNNATSEVVDTDYDMYYVQVAAIVGDDGVVYVVDNDDEDGAQLMYAFDKDKNRIMLDGEILSTGQIIYVASDKSTDKLNVGFYAVAKIITTNSSGVAVITTVLRPMSEWNNIINTSTVPLITTIKYASKFHNTNWSTISGITTYVTATTSMWCDYNGNPISMLNVNGNTYKWEITLYQGDCDISGNPLIASYQYIGDDAFDMVVGTGSVCGSYTDRIQIASDDAFTGNGVLNEDAILPGLKSDTLVLQTRYMDLSTIVGDNEPDIFSGTRCYVKSYSDGYGYVYPETTNLNSSIVSSSTHVQFFKHSNQESAILDTDIVDWGLSSSLPFFFYEKVSDDTTDYKPHSDESEWIQNVSITNRLIVISKGSVPEVLTGIASGQKVLLTNQGGTGDLTSGAADFSYRNGVYRYYTLTHNGIVYNCLERASSYTSWSDYIGKIIYVRHGGTGSVKIGGTNQQSLAQAGTYTLWDPLNDSVPGDSDLAFTTELPILLFQNKLKDGRSYDFFSADDDYPDSGMLDGEYLDVGNVVLCASGKVFQVITSGISVKAGGSGSWDTYTNPQGISFVPSAGDYTYFTHGSTHAERVFKFPSTDACWDLHTAKILKNTSSYTYVSPNTLLAAGMKLKLSHGHTVYTASKETTGLLDVKAVNTVLYCVRHQILSNPTSLISDESTDNNTPWKYEIRSYFKASDENPFYANEVPYVVLYKNNMAYSNLAMLKDSDDTSSTATYRDASVVTGRSVKLSAKYVQYQGASWESYRWVLKDSDGTTLQDTGKQYTNDMSVIFYGLTNEEISGSSTYYALLYVEDDLGNTLQYTIKLSVAQSDVLTLPVPLTADYDCDAQAVKLEYHDNGILVPGYRILSSTDNSGMDYKYSSNFSTYWDGGIKYADDVAYVTGKNYDQAAPVDYTTGSTIDGSDRDIIYGDLLSRAERYGVNYYTYFNKSDMSHSASSDYALQLTSQTDSSSSLENNELYFETQVTMADNFCGDIVSWQIQGTDWDEIEDPYMTTAGASNNKSGYIEFKFKVPDNLINNTVNASRNKINFSVTAYEVGTTSVSAQGHEKSLTLSNLSLFALPSKTMYYLQLKDVVGADDTYRTTDYEYLHVALTHPLYLKRDDDGDTYYTGGEYAFGNLCLVKNDSGVTNKYFTYWVEDRPLLNNPVVESSIISSSSQSNKVQEMQSSDRTYGSTGGKLIWGSEGLPDYPSVESERWYWRDGSDIGTVTNPTTWSGVDSNDAHVEILVPMNRHYTMDNKAYHIICRLIDVDGLYSGLIGSSVEITEVAVNNSSTSILLGANGIYGTIVIEQIEEE